ncbi:MAG TPA: serine/threonine-protein kinase [Urbifossiella sp.]
MNATQTIHPTPDQLKAFGLGKLAPATVDTVVQHLETCIDCRNVVAESSGDSFLRRLREAQEERPLILESVETSTAILPPELAACLQYENIQPLGKGGMGVVFLAKNKLMNRLEVLKVVNRGLLARTGADVRFLREIQSAARLQHPNVVAAHSAFQLGDLLVFSMEYVAGNELAKLIQRRGPLPVANACYYAQQVAFGLQHAHEKGMIHRDIKPANLILHVDRENKRHLVKILDFGLAKVNSERGFDPGLTGEGRMLGTPDYIAPEQILDAQSADIRADIYSLGCSLYFFLTGRPPHQAASLYELLRKHQEEDAQPVNSIHPEIPAEVAAVVAKLMARDPTERFQTPAEAASALEPFVGMAAVLEWDCEPLPAPIESVPELSVWEPPLPPSPIDGVKTPAMPLRQSRRLPRWLWPAAAIGLALIATLGILASGVLKVKTKDGVIVLEDLPTDAEVLVDGERVSVSRKGETAMVSTVRGGPHKLKVMQNGKNIFSSDLTIDIGGEPVRVRVEQAAPPPVPLTPQAEPAPPPPTIPPSKVEKRPQVERDDTTKIRDALLNHQWHYHDSLYPPGDLCQFHADGTFHKWKWQYWIMDSHTMRIHYDRNKHDKQTGILFTFNQNLTKFTGEFTDPNGKIHKVIGTRQ